MPPDSQASNPPVVEDLPLSSTEPQHDDPDYNDNHQMESDTPQPPDLSPPAQSQDQTTPDIELPLQLSPSSLTDELHPISNPSQISSSSHSSKVIQPSQQFQPPTESNPLPSSYSITPSNHPDEEEVDDVHDELLTSLLRRAKEKARLIERKEVSVAETGGSGHSDCGSSVTLQNIIRLDGEEKLKLDLSRPLRPSALTTQPTNSYRKPFKPSNNTKQIPLNQPIPENFDRLASIRDRRLGHDAPSNKTPRSHLEWHDLPVQELTRETKMEIQAMRLHRTLDPKSFVKGGIEKSLKEPMPTKFLFGHIIDGSMNGGGSTTKKRSFVDGLVQDDKSQEWAKKKYTHIQNVSGRNSGGKNFYKSVMEKRLK
ncbi:hypothetical protein VP01_147g9 [Puccinia sorghi]|uniref:Fcf2 pre-rRNA processing C-terminal domain-containing protein n=1 Tax=Puccinia sorghi TaxID=27349 RepID=A0A0L6VK63_9BASI|nr:hypothetical protein VP01_147g9 [Puccinia sorghi]